jgi:hypothetical protein
MKTTVVINGQKWTIEHPSETLEGMLEYQQETNGSKQYVHPDAHIVVWDVIKSGGYLWGWSNTTELPDAQPSYHNTIKFGDTWRHMQVLLFLPPEGPWRHWNDHTKGAIINLGNYGSFRESDEHPNFKQMSFVEAFTKWLNNNMETVYIHV